MRSSMILVVGAVLVVAITIEALPSPIRYVTPNPNVRYSMRVVTPKPGIRYLRSIDDHRIDEHPFPEGLSTLVTATEEDVDDVLDEESHQLRKRSPERVVINYKPPPRNGPRYA